MRSPIPTPRTLGAVAAACAAVTLAAGCSAGGTAITAAHPTPTPLPVHRILTLAAARSRQVNSFVANVSINVSSGSVSTSLSGTMQDRTKPLLIEARFSLTTAGSSLPGGMTEIINGSAIYLKMPVITKKLGKPWLKMTFAEIRRSSGLNLSQLLQESNSGNPFHQTEMMAASKNARKVGTQIINGVRTTEYTGSYSVQSVLKSLPPAERSLGESGVSKLGVRTAHFRIWLDANDQPRQVVVREVGTSATITVRTDVVSINQPVNVRLPRPSQVRKLPASALKGTGGSSGGA